jgi:Uma2 family endonuclease
MKAAADNRRKIWTEEELEALPEDGYIHEVIGGKLVMSPKNDFFHGRICTRLLVALENFNQDHRLGVVLDSSTGFWMSNRNCRAPDVSFVSKSRLIELNFKPLARKFFPGAPDLAVEVRAQGNSRSEIDARLKDFFSSGAQIAWVVDSDMRFVEVCHSLADRKIMGPGALLDGEHLLPGFQYPIGSLFKEWDWE